MDIDNLVEMANRIGEFFQAMPDRAEAEAGIVEHLRKFWEPRMRMQLLGHLDEHDGAGLLPIVLESLREGREALAPLARDGAARLPRTGSA
ncbi:MAG: formate dehydrogenase subunit delta [Burkholderiales bacterium]|nr:formate dehydrogenase subunit delta [Burkholderiales bacterium]MDE2455855.1 formate dehydrogenase subunit delta [Burkholderiales bacterium]